MPPPGDEVRELMAGVPTDDPAKNDVAVTPDQSDAYVAVPARNTADEEEIVRVPTAGGTPEQVVAGGSSPAVSPDGTTLNTAVFTVDREATSMAQARRLGPGEEPQTDVSWDATAAFGDGLAVVEMCCDIGFEDRWHNIAVDPADGSIDSLVPDFRLEARHLDSNAGATGLLIVEDGGLEGGDLLRWHGSGSPEVVTSDVVAAAW